MTTLPELFEIDCNSMGLPGCSAGKESACSEGDLGSIPGLGRSLEEGMANHFSILAWRIPWTEEPGGLQSVGSQRVGHGRVTRRSTQHITQCPLTVLPLGPHDSPTKTFCLIVFHLLEKLIRPCFKYIISRCFY